MSNAMGLVIPTPSITAGPEYATEVSNDLEVIAGHTHTGAANNDGYQVPSAGLNINADLSFQQNNLTTLRSSRFFNQSSVLAGNGDVGCVYEKSGDLWYNNSAGTPVQITSGSSVIGSVGGYTITETSVNLTINAGDTTVLVSCDTSNTIIVTLPAANSVAAGRFYIIKDATGSSATNNITINASGSDKIDVVDTSVVIRNSFGSVCLVSDGVGNWLMFMYEIANSPIATSAAVVNVPASTFEITYLINVNSNSVTVNLPALSLIRNGTRVLIKDSGHADIAGNTITITPNGIDKLEGLAGSKVISTAFGECYLQSFNIGAGWFLI